MATITCKNCQGDGYIVWDNTGMIPREKKCDKCKGKGIISIPDWKLSGYEEDPVITELKQEIKELKDLLNKKL